MSKDVAYLAQGKLYLKTGDGEPQLIESRFGQEVQHRAAQIHDRNAWKSQGTGARFMRGGLWAQPDHDPAALRVAISGVSRGCAPGELFYALETDEIAGVFRLRDSGKDEQRLLHTADFRVRHLNADPGRQRVACVVERKKGGSSIAVMREDGSEMTDVTQGDTIDEAPRWVPGLDPQLVFQSAGIGRNAQGFAVGRSPYSIQKLDIERGELTSLSEDPKHDLLSPHMTADGTLYFIRRPYTDPMRRVSPLRGLLDLVLFPFRLVYAIFHYLNFFTVRYTGKPLTSAGGAQQRSADIRQMMVWGNMIDAQKAAGRATPGEDAPDLVPSTWELVRQKPSGSADVIAKGVLSFDLEPDGSVLYSNGSAIFRLTADGRKARLVKEAFIEQVISLGEHSQAGAVGPSA